MSIRSFFHKAFRRKNLPGMGSVVGACLVLYFAYHAIQGPRGLIVYNHLRTETLQAEALLASLEEKSRDLDTKVMLMRPQSVSPDMLEEQLRAILNYSHPDDLIILVPQKPSAPSAH